LKSSNQEVNGRSGFGGSSSFSRRGSYGGLGTYATAAGIHGPSSGVVLRLRSINSPFDGTAILSDKQAADLIAGRWFVLVRTARHPDGELRGQIEPVK